MQRENNRMLSKVYSPRSQDVTMMSNGLNSGFLVSFASGVVKSNCWMKQQSNTHIQGNLQRSKLSVWVLCTEPNSTQQVWYVGIQ